MIENCVVFYERVKSKMVIAIKRGARYITSSSHHHHLTKVYARTKQNKHECNECRRQPSHTWDLYPRSGLRMKRVHTTTPKKKTNRRAVPLNLLKTPPPDQTNKHLIYSFSPMCSHASLHLDTMVWLERIRNGTERGKRDTNKTSVVTVLNCVLKGS